MQPLDLPTLLFVHQAMATLIFAFTLAGAWRTRRSEALWLWTAGFAVLALLLLARAPIMNIWGYRASLPMGHNGALLHTMLLLLGMRAFLRIRSHWRVTAMAVAVVAAGATGAIALGANPAWSLWATQTTGAVLLAIAAFHTLRAHRRNPQGSLLIMATVLAVSASINLTRGISVLPLGATSEMLNRASAPWLLAMTCLLVAQGFAILLLVNGALERELRALADFDPLTGLLNRRGFEGRMSRLMQRQRGTPLALAMLDLDRFKAVNDRHGHCVGDEVLTEVGQRLQRCTRPTDVVARLGGEEFVVVLVDAPPHLLSRLAERIRAVIAEAPIITQACRLDTTISVGIATRLDEESLGAWIQRADEALYRAKSNGRDRVIVAGAHDAATLAMPS